MPPPPRSGFPPGTGGGGGGGSPDPGSTPIGLKIRQLFLLEQRPDLLGRVDGEEVYAVTAPVMERMSALRSAPGAIAVCLPGDDPFDHPRDCFPWLILDGIQDPGNVGTIIRTAEAFGFPQVVLLPPAPSPFQEKVLRASAGSSFRVHCWRPTGPDELLERVEASGISLWGLEANGEYTVRQLPGSNGPGISSAMKATAFPRFSGRTSRAASVYPWIAKWNPSMPPFLPLCSCIPGTAAIIHNKIRLMRGKR